MIHVIHTGSDIVTVVGYRYMHTLPLSKHGASFFVSVHQLKASGSPSVVW